MTAIASAQQKNQEWQKEHEHRGFGAAGAPRGRSYAPIHELMPAERRAGVFLRFHSRPQRWHCEEREDEHNENTKWDSQARTAERKAEHANEAKKH